VPALPPAIGGIGVSAGVKGARIGIDATGHEHTHAGRYGLYYRARGARVASSGGTVLLWIIGAAIEVGTHSRLWCRR